MPHLLILNEGQEAGLPVWRFAAAREEAVYVHAPALSLEHFAKGEREVKA
jgi:hypothetical protein